MVNFGSLLVIAGLDFVIRDEGAVNCIEHSTINCAYIRMLGSGAHNILTSYLTTGCDLAKTSGGAASCTETMKDALPAHAGANYLEMTAGTCSRPPNCVLSTQG